MRKAYLACPVCTRRLWVEVTTDGKGHHTEAWPAHTCVAPAPASERRGSPSTPTCVDCGCEMEGRHGLAKRCWPCRSAWRKHVQSASAARRMAAKAASSAHAV